MINILRRKFYSMYVKFLRRNEFESIILREYFKKKFEIDVGLYSYGCFDASRISRNTMIGRYCSVAATAHILGRNHGMNFITLHPYLYNENLKFQVMRKVDFVKQYIGDGVWIGHNAIILPSCEYVGRGSVIGAGAVVSKNVPDYAVVVGNPARIVKYRFSDDVIEKIDRTKWWEMSREELADFLKKRPNLAFDPTSDEFKE